jgi:hypothetical protein
MERVGGMSWWNDFVNMERVGGTSWWNELVERVCHGTRWTYSVCTLTAAECMQAIGCMLAADHADCRQLAWLVAAR